MNAGKTGDDLAELVISEIEMQPDETARQIVYARVLRALTGHRLYVPPEPAEIKRKPMSDREAARFECTPVPFGKYADTLVGSTPIEYLCRLCDPSPWMVDLKRYLLSREAKSRMDD